MDPHKVLLRAQANQIISAFHTAAFGVVLRMLAFSYLFLVTLWIVLS